jgi:hypothetical protein
MYKYLRAIKSRRYQETATKVHIGIQTHLKSSILIIVEPEGIVKHTVAFANEAAIINLRI